MVLVQPPPQSLHPILAAAVYGHHGTLAIIRRILDEHIDTQTYIAGASFFLTKDVETL